MLKEITYIKNETTGCWECNSHSLNDDGYPIARRCGKGKKLYRLFYELYKGPVPEGLCVRHLCNNRICLNPDHLDVGTQFDNIQDAIKAGTHMSQSKLIRNRVSEQQAKEIQQKYRPNEYSHGRLAKEYGISRTTIQRIIKGEVTLFPTAQ